MTEQEKLFCKGLWENGASINSIAKLLPYKQKKAIQLIKQLIQCGYLAERKRGDIIKERLKSYTDSGIYDNEKLSELLGLKVGTTKNYKYVLNIHNQRPKKNYRPTVLSEKTNLIIEDLKKGLTTKEIQQKYGVSRQYVSEVKIKYVEKKQ